MDWVLDRLSHCGAFIGNTKIIDLVFAGNAVIIAEPLEVLMVALEAWHKQVTPLGLKVSWPNTKAQVFRRLTR